MKKEVFEELVVVKRSGQRVNFNGYKIAVAIKQAFDCVYDNYDEKKINLVYEEVLKEIESEYETRKTINVEDIQDLIESKLKAGKFQAVYDAFHDYREKRAASRKVFTIKAQHKFVKAMERIANYNSLKSDNSLKPKEILLNYGKTVANEFTKSYLIDNKYLRAHEEGQIFIRDMEEFPLGIIGSAHLDFTNYLNEVNSINNLTTQILMARDEINEELSVPALDYLLESWLIRQYKFYYRENIINYAKLMGFDKYLNLKKILDLINRENIIADKTADFNTFAYSDQALLIFRMAYQDCLAKITDILNWKIGKLFFNLNNNSGKPKISLSFGTNHSFAGTLINEAILAVLTNTSPLTNLHLIFKINQRTTEETLDQISDLIIKGHQLPLAFINNSFNKDLAEVEYFASGVRIFENNNASQRTSAGRMVVGETFINMSRLGLKYAGRSLKNFYAELDEVLDLVKNELLMVFETIGNKNKENYQILFNNNIVDDEKLEKAGKIRKVIKNGNLNIGLVGLKECVTALEKDEAKTYDLAVNIINYLNKKCRLFATETKLNFYLCEPSGLQARRELMSLDKAIYGEIKGITDKNHYDLIGGLASIKDHYDKIAHLQKLLSGGSLLNISLPKNISSKRLCGIIHELNNADIGFVKFSFRKVGG